MLPDRFGALVNLAGFAAALTLYAMLLVMVVRNPDAAMVSPLSRGGPRPPLRPHAWRHEPLLVATALLGLVWNLVALGLYGLEDFGVRVPPWLGALAFTALGFLPAVVLHGALRAALTERRDRVAAWVVGAGYCLSAVAGAFHVAAAVERGTLPSSAAFQLLVAGFGVLVVLLALQARRRLRVGRALSLGALALFAVSALHLAGHEALVDSWPVELVGHHASLPLALAILYQDYPFALADLFLKRALVVVIALALVLVLYAGAVVWLVPASPEPVATVGFVGLGIAMAVAYPWLRRGAHWFVDAVMLQRANYVELRANIAAAVAAAETPEEVLRETCARVGPAVAARLWNCWRLDGGAPTVVGGCCTAGVETPGASVSEAHDAWLASNHAETTHADATKTGAVAIVPTAEPPRYAFALGDLAGGRRLLSDDLAMLDAVVQSAARRVDQIRLRQERADQRVREAEIRQLASEAELRALRAQINPHFLFNALTTIGYLIQTTPECALEKLVQLTELLRRVLRSEGGVTTLGKELELVRLYLDLEHARFEERLRVEIDVPAALHEVAVPTLVLQPLVENAIKHGIAPLAAGGLVEIRAGLEEPAPGTAARILSLSVRDTGRGLRSDRPGTGIGLRNVEDRLHHHFGDAASLRFESGGRGTVVTLRIPTRAVAPAALAGEGRPR